MYRWTPVSMGDTFQELLRICETADNTERYIKRDITRYLRSTHEYGNV